MVEPVDEHLTSSHFVNRGNHTLLFALEVTLFSQGRQGLFEQVTVEEVLGPEQAFTLDFRIANVQN